MVSTFNGVRLFLLFESVSCSLCHVVSAGQFMSGSLCQLDCVRQFVSCSLRQAVCGMQSLSGRLCQVSEKCLTQVQHLLQHIQVCVLGRLLAGSEFEIGPGY